MAQKKGILKKIGEFIGLTEEDEPREERNRGYGSGSYGRQEAYEPLPQRKSGSGRSDAERYPRNSAARNSRMNGSSSPYENSSESRRIGDSAREGRADRTYRDWDAEGRVSSKERSYAGARLAEERYSERPAQEQNKPRRSAANAEQEQCAVLPLVELKDCCEVIDQLLQNNTVVVTMQKLDDKTVERSVDTLSGAVYALDANMNKISDRSYLITPKNVVVNIPDAIRRN